MADLVPKVIINQEFDEAVPVIPTTQLVPGVIGPCTLQVYQGEVTGYTYTGGTALVKNEFPDHISGAVINDDTAVLDVPEFPDVLRPHVYISTVHGIQEVPATYITYYLSETPPKFSVSPSAQVIFRLSAGTTGEYRASTGYFWDTSASFDNDLVGLNDKIYIKNADGNYHHELSVVSSEPAILENGTKLNVVKVNKRTVTAATSNLSTQDVDTNLRTLTNASETFVTSGVNAGDIVTVDNWQRIVNHLGGDYAAADVNDERVFTDLDGDFVSGAGVLANDVVWYDRGAGTLVPAFVVTATPGSDSLMIVGNAISEWPLAAGAGVDDAYEVRRYATLRDLDGASAFAANDGTFGSQGQTIDAKVPTGTNRIFKSPTWLTAGTVAIGDFIILNRTGLPAVGPFIAPGNGLIFEVQDVTTHGNGYIEVSDAMPNDWPAPTKSAYDDAETYDYEIRDESLASVSEQYGASYGAQGSGPGSWRLFTDNDAAFDFTALPTPPIVGDIVKDDTGLSIFRVEAVAPGAVVNALHVSDIIPGTPLPAATSTQFMYDIAKLGVPKELTVITVDSETQLSVVNVETDPPISDNYFGLVIDSIEYPDSGSILDYYIEGVKSGVQLTGTLLVTYTARRTDLVGQLLQITRDNYESIIGEATPANPLALGCSKVFEIYDDTIFAVMVEDPDQLDDWTAALQVAEDTRIYVPCVCSQDENVLALLRTHVATMSGACCAGERITYQCHKEVVQETKTSEQPTDTLSYTKTGTLTNLVFNRDITLNGVIPTDVISGEATSGPTVIDFSQIRILQVQRATPLPGQTTIRVDQTNTLPVGAGTIADWDIKSKNLSLDERKDKQNAYVLALQEALDTMARRISNIWPDTVVIPFSDDVGIFGSGTPRATMGGWLLGCTYGGATGLEEPVTPFTKRRYGTYYQLLDPLSGRPDLQDDLVNGGNMVLRQSAINVSPAAIREVTIDIRDFRWVFGNVRRQLDYFTKVLRIATEPYVGPNIIDANTFDTIAVVMGAARDLVVDEERNLKDARMKTLGQDPARPDGIVSAWDVEVYYGFGRLTVDLVVVA